MFTARFFESKSKVVLALLLPAVVIYFKSLHFEFTSLDEQWMIVTNESLKNAGQTVKEAFSKPVAEIYYRPLLVLSFLVDYSLGQLSPEMYHLTNLLLHLTCVLLLFRFLCLNRVSRQAAFFYALIFSLHPIQLHAVAWVPGRNDLMLCLFTLASLISLLRFFESSNKRSLLWHGLFYVAALLTKETAVVLPLVFITYYAVHRPLRSRQMLGFSSAWLLLALGWLLLHHALVPASSGQGGLSPAALKEFIPAILLYTGKAFFPAQQSVFPLVRDASVLPGLLALIVLVVLWRKPGLENKRLGAAALVMFFTLLVVPVWFSAARGVSEHYEHRIYTSMAGLMLFFSQLKFSIASKQVYAFVIVILCVFALRTYTRMEVYRNERSFLNTGVKESPDFHLFLFQKGDVLCSEHKYDSALFYYNKAIALRSNIAILYSNRGSALFALGLFKESGFNYTKAIALAPEFDYRFHMNRCVAFAKCNYIELAMADLVVLKKCCQSVLQPELEKDVLYKWNLLMKGLSRRIRANPSNHELLYKMARFHFMTGRNQEGLADLRAALALVPGHAVYLGLLKQHL